MKDTLIKNLHIFIFLYIAFTNFEVYEEKTAEIETLKGTITSTEQRLAKSKKKLAKIDQFNKDLSASEDRVSAVVREIKKVQRQLPSEINDTEVQSVLIGQTRDLRMREPQVKPNLEVVKGFYFAKTYNFQAKSTFLQSLIFFEKLEELAKADRILNVKYVKLSDDPSSDKRSQFRGLKLEAEVESYRYNSNYKIQQTPITDKKEKKS